MVVYDSIHLILIPQSLFDTVRNVNREEASLFYSEKSERDDLSATVTATKCLHLILRYKESPNVWWFPGHLSFLQKLS